MSHIMPEPEAPPPLPVDPNLAQEQADAKASQTRALQTELQSDSASIMARYGTNLALAGSSGYPVAAPAAAAAPAALPVFGSVFRNG